MSIKLSEVTLSKSATNKFANIKQRTGVTPNIMGRIALMKALEASPNVSILKNIESFGQKIPKEIFFGDDADVYELAIELYVTSSGFDGSTRDLVNKLVDFGAHSIPVVKSIHDFEYL